MINLTQERKKTCRPNFCLDRKKTFLQVLPLLARFFSQIRENSH